MPVTNDLAGVWRLQHLTSTAGGDAPYGAAPDGLLTFTEDLHCSTAVVASDLPPVASGDRMTATDEENRAIVRGSLAFYGTYRVSDDGSFIDQHVLGSTNPALNGRTMQSADIKIAVTGDELVMTSSVTDAPLGQSTWQRVGPAGTPTAPNTLAAAWRMQSAEAEVGGETVELFGADPGGSLIFAEGRYFTDVLHRSDIPPVAGGDILDGSDEENRQIVQGSLIVFGQYTVDEDGVFQDEIVLGSSMPNWKGMRRDRRALTETVRGDQLTEHLDDGDGVVVSIEFSRAPAA